MDVGDRSQSEVVSVVLLFGLVIVTAAVMLLVGVQAIEEVRGSVDVENDINAMREVDSRLSRVAYNDNVVETLDFGSRPGEIGSQVEVDSSSHMNITVNRQFSQCSASIRMGALEREAQNGEIVAYEGGGVWRRPRNGNASTMVSPPDFQYENGTINFPLVAVNGTVVGSGDQLLAKKNVTRSRQRSRQITKELSNSPDCRPPQNLTITVNSTYYRAWGRYFEQVTPATATYDHPNETATVVLKTRAGTASTFAAGGNVTSNVDYVADIKINGTGYHANNFHLPVAFQVYIEGKGNKTITYQNGVAQVVNRDPNMTRGHDDLNDPEVAYEESTYPEVSVNVPAGRNLSVWAISYFCDPDAWDPNGNGKYDPGEPAISVSNSSVLEETAPNDQSGGSPRSGNQSRRCIAPNLEDRVMRTISSSGGSTYLKVYNKTQNNPGAVGGFNSASSDQRTPKQVLDNSEIGYNPGTGLLDLDSNQAVFIYELNEASGDFNDAIVTVQAYQQGSLANVGSISIKISTSQVQISDG